MQNLEEIMFDLQPPSEEDRSAIPRQSELGRAISHLRLQLHPYAWPESPADTQIRAVGESCAGKNAFPDAQ